jgi:hypothetical protein
VLAVVEDEQDALSAHRGGERIEKRSSGLFSDAEKCGDAEEDE